MNTYDLKKRHRVSVRMSDDQFDFFLELWFAKKQTVAEIVGMIEYVANLSNKRLAPTFVDAGKLCRFMALQFPEFGDEEIREGYPRILCYIANDHGVSAREYSGFEGRRYYLSSILTEISAVLEKDEASGPRFADSYWFNQYRRALKEKL